MPVEVSHKEVTDVVGEDEIKILIFGKVFNLPFPVSLHLVYLAVSALRRPFSTPESVRLTFH